MQVSANYLAGIREGRAVRKLIDSANLEQVAQAELAFCARVSQCAGSNLHKDFIRGIRDFWLNQLAKLH